MTSVVRPRPASTRCCRRAGRRAPTSQPTSVPASTVATLMSVPVTRGAQHGTGRDNAARMPRADVLPVSLGSTAGLRAADAELHAALARGGASVVQVAARPQPDVRTLVLTDLVWARAAGAATRAALRAHRPRAVLYSTVTAAFPWLAPGAIRFDAPAAANRPGRHGLWQRPLERRRLRQAPLLVPWAEGSLAEAPAPRAPAVVVPIPVEPSGPSAGERDIAAITYAANPHKKGLDRVLAAWAQAR